MQYQKFGSKYVVRIDRGEEIVSSLEDFVVENEIKLGFIEGIGAADEIKIGLFSPETKEYSTKVLTGDHEITGIKGNISQKDGQPYLHLHINASDTDYNTYGGHLDYAKVSGTCEVIVMEIEGTVERKFDQGVGLNLYKFEN